MKATRYVRWALSAAAIVAAMAIVARTEQLEFTPHRISEMIDRGEAPRRGPTFAPSRFDSWSCCWRESDNHLVYFIVRNGRPFGEYREERFASGRRFMEINEAYLVVKAREPEFRDKVTELPFVSRREKLQWTKQPDGKLLWTGSTVRWSLFGCDDNGTIVRHGNSLEQTLVRRPIRVRVPTDRLIKGKEYWLQYRHKALNAFEEAFGTGNFASIKLVKGECSFFLVWPLKEPAIVFELHERVPNPAHDPTSFLVRTKKIGSKVVDMSTVKDSAITIVPDQGNK